MTDDLFEILIGSKTFTVSKKLLCSSIPYFEKMFCCDLLESKENKVTLDLDESGFSNIINFVYFNTFVLSMENVLQTYDCCEYLMIEDLQRECSDFFFENFNINYLPDVLNAIDERSKLITPRNINCFIRRHFLLISNTDLFYNLTDHAMEYFLKLDLIVDSEYQVFDAIKRWVLFDNYGGRNKYLTNFLKLIRWCNVEQNDLIRIKNDGLVINQQELIAIIVPPSNDCQQNCTTNRVINNSPLIIHAIDESTIEISIFDGSSLCCPCGLFQFTESLSTNLITDEHVTDILYDSGRKGIRVDWQLRMFKYLDMIGTDDSYHGQIYRYIMSDFVKSSPTSELSTCLGHRNAVKVKLEKFDSDDHNSVLKKYNDKHLLLESNGIFIGIGSTDLNEQNYHLISPLEEKTWFYTKQPAFPAFHVCIIKDQAFIIKMNLDLWMVNLITKSLKISTLSKIKGLKFEDVQLFSHNDELMLSINSNQVIYKYNQTLQNWSFMCQLKTSRQLITISSTYSPTKDIEMIYSVN